MWKEVTPQYDRKINHHMVIWNHAKIMKIPSSEDKLSNSRDLQQLWVVFGQTRGLTYVGDPLVMPQKYGEPRT
jgi:hypothetical protein